jgi:integrase
MIGALKISALTTHTIQCMYNALARGEKNSRPLSAKSIRNLHGVLHKALEQAVILGYLKFNPSDACTLPRVVKTEIKPIEEEKIKEMLSVIKGHKYENLFTIDLFTGMRLGEIIGLTWDCVDFKNGLLTVNKQLQRERVKGGQYRFVSPKER